MVLSKERIREELSKGNIKINSIDRNRPFNEDEQIQGSSVDLYLDINNPIIIQPGQTIALRSREIIYISNKLTGFIAPRRR
jgi:deoxycytidine triphosphate deaminase